MQWFLRWRKAFIYLLCPWLLALVIQQIGRIYLLLANVNSESFPSYQADLFQMIWIGTRFDVRVATLYYGSLLIIASALAGNANCFRYWSRSQLALSVIGTGIIGWLAIVNIFFYKTYQRAIDLFIFGLFDDDTTAILLTLWQDYPVIKGLLLFIALLYGCARLFKKWQQVCQSLPALSVNRFRVFGYTMFVLCSVFIGIRGSLSTFPLRESDTQVSDIKLLNALVPNAGMLLAWAYKDYRHNNHFDVATEAEGQQLLSHFFGQKQPADLSVLMATTPENPWLKSHPPHVVLAVMESMGQHLLSYDNEQRDLLGALWTHWQKDIRFDRFVSEGDGTIDSLSRLFIRSPMDHISQSSAQYIDFKSNMLKPYLQNGYKIVFVTSGNGGWRNLNQFLPHLGVSEFVEQNRLKALYPEAKIGTWGVPDEYMFRYMEKRLAQADAVGEHLLIISMSTTHHPPYRVPDHINNPQIKLEPAIVKRLTNLGNQNELQPIFSTLRYSNDQLGQFISWVKQRSLAEHTIIAVTGDHNIRGIGYADPQEGVLGHAVPFYLYIPKNYQQNIHYEPTRVGSHKDILPTLYHLSLSATSYYQMGCNLLAPQSDSHWCFAYNPHVIVDQLGAYIDQQFYPWVNQQPTDLRLQPEQAMSEAQLAEFNRRALMTSLLKWQLNRQVQEANVKPIH